MHWVTRLVLRGLEFANRRLPSRKPKHLRVGRRGELEAYLHLSGLGYKLVSGNFRVPYNRGEIDLIGWDDGVLCFIEVKTRTDARFAPPSTAVDLAKKRHILSVARRYLRQLSNERHPPCRFDIVSVVFDRDLDKPQIALQRGAFSWDAGKPRRNGNYWRRDFRDVRDRRRK